MGEALDRIARQRRTAGDLQAVVRVMKAHAAAAIGPYLRAVADLDAYAAALARGLAACLRADPAVLDLLRSGVGRGTAVIAFGTDRGLVGPLNDALSADVGARLGAWAAPVATWVVGARLHERLAAHARTLGLAAAPFAAPTSPAGVTALIAALLEAVEAAPGYPFAAIEVLHHRPAGGARTVLVAERLVPLDHAWLDGLRRAPWPTNQRPEAPAGAARTLEALVREHLFVALARAAVEAAASEHASRLAAMLRAEHDVGERVTDLGRAYHQARQRAIADELFDLVTGVAALEDPP